MFSNIGKKIKTLATVICILGIIASIFISILLFVKADDWSTRRYSDYDRYSRSYRSVVDSSSATEMRIYAGLLLVFVYRLFRRLPPRLLRCRLTYRRQDRSRFS